MNKKYLVLGLVAILFSACGSSSKSAPKFDIAEYLPRSDSTKSYLEIIKDKEGNQQRNTYDEVVLVTEKDITIKIDNKVNRTFTIHKETIEEKDYSSKIETISLNRLISKGSTLYTIEKTIKDEEIKVNSVVIGTKSTESKKECKLKDELQKLDIASIPYKGDILKFECIKKESIDTKIKKEWEEKFLDYKSGSVESDYDLSYFYLKKEVGLIVDVNDDCYVKKDGVLRIDDNAKSKDCKEETFVHKLFL